MSRARRVRRQSAFTLVELLTVIAVIGILTAITLGAVAGAKQRTAVARTRAELGAIASALEEFKRLYGDYPQLGDFTQAVATPTSTAGPGLQSTQAKLFNTLTGVFGARAFANGDRLNGPNLLDVGRFNVVGTIVATTFLVPTVTTRGAPPIKVEQNAALVDPWGRYYIYYYKSARNPGGWQASSYVLYSAGPRVAASGNQTAAITPTTGLLLTTQTAEMADNIYVNP